MSYSFTHSNSFTRTDAKYLASKVATDLMRIKRFYGEPSDKKIQDYELEIIELLSYGYLKKVTYGFQRNGNWIPPTLIYQTSELISNQIDDDPGRVPIGADVSNASFKSYLEYSAAWEQLSIEEQKHFEKKLPFSRSEATEPGIDGHIEKDKNYHSGGKSLGRSSIKKYDI